MALWWGDGGSRVKGFIRIFECRVVCVYDQIQIGGEALGEGRGKRFKAEDLCWSRGAKEACFQEKGEYL